MLYDFSLEQGDQITLEGVDFIANVDEITVSNGTRKRIDLVSVQLFGGSSHVHQIWIEGVGTNAHPFYPDFFMYAPVFSSGGGYRVYTQCNFQNGGHIFGDSEYCGGFTAQMGTNENQFVEAGITFSPNPLVSTLTIDSDVALQKATLQFFNVQGKLVKEIQHLNGTKFTVTRGDLTRGMYMVQLSENGKILKSTKLMVH